MLQRLTLFLLALSLSITAGAQEPIDQEIEAFSRLDVNGYFDVTLIKGDKNHIRIDGPGRLLEKVDIDEGGAELTLGLKPTPNNYEGRPLKVEITYTDAIEDIEVSVGGEVACAETLTTRKMKLTANTGASLDLKVAVEDLQVKANTGGIIEIEGSAAYQRVNVNTGGIYKAYQLQSEDIDVKANTGGIAHLQAEQRLEASANTGGIINYRGNPPTLVVDTSLGGMVEGN